MTDEPGRGQRPREDGFGDAEKAVAFVAVKFAIFAVLPLVIALTVIFFTFGKPE